MKRKKGNIKNLSKNLYKTIVLCNTFTTLPNLLKLVHLLKMDNERFQDIIFHCFFINSQGVK